MPQDGAQQDLLVRRNAVMFRGGVALGILELEHIARGILVSDAVVKKAPVTILRSTRQLWVGSVASLSQLDRRLSESVVSMMAPRYKNPFSHCFRLLRMAEMLCAWLRIKISIMCLTIPPAMRWRKRETFSWKQLALREGI